MGTAAEFVHLHQHSEWSLLDGACRVRDMPSRAAALGMKALAITDHGAMHGVLDFYQACETSGVKPIIGCEVYVAPRSRREKDGQVDKDPYHFVLLARDATGYRNLVRLVSRAQLEGFYYKPRVDRELLAEHAEGITALSACLGAEVPQLLLQEKVAEAEAAAAFYRDIYGRDHFFLELQDHGIPEQRAVNRELVKMAPRLGVGLVATNDAHYLRKEDARAHDILLCIQTAANLDAPKRLRFPTEEFYLKSPQEMAALFAEVPAALRNTLAVAEQCEVKFEFGKYLLPRFPLPEGHTPGSYLRQLCEERLPLRYPHAGPEVRRQMDYELELIDRMGFSGYLLIVWDFCDFARRRGIPVGPGRGSAAGCLVSYIIGITNIDPLRYKLVFERFLNPERVEMPDIDIDFCYERRGEVIEYVTERYGAECVAQIAAFGTMGARAVIRDVGRTLGFAPSETDRIAKLVPEGVNISLADALQPGSELAQLVAQDGRVHELVDVAKLLEGTPRHASVHAAGVVIAPGPLADIVPLMRTKDGRPAIQFDMDQCKKLGLLKMDFLGLRNLTVIDDCRRRIEARTGQPFDTDNLPLDDAATYRMISEGHTVGIFQVESSGMTDLVRRLRPNNIEDIIAAGALFRPGPMENIPLYLKAKHEGNPTYPHPDLEPILRDTYGIMIYQEQVQQVAAKMAGFTLGEADMLRRAISKKDRELMDVYHQRFVEGCVRNGHSAALAEDLFAQIEKFAGYGFNRAHSAAYGYITYQTAYLKTNYPVEYMAALLTSMAGGNTKKKDSAAIYIAEARRLGIAVLPPDVNESRADFTDLPGGKIRVGLGAVKNVGTAAVESIVQNREQGGPYRSLTEFCGRVDLRVCNRRAVESLIKAGAFDFLGVARARLLAGLEGCMKAAQGRARQRARGQRSLFDLLGSAPAPADAAGTEAEVAEEWPDVPEFAPRERLAMEKEVLGLYISGHPLEAHVEDLRLRTHGVSSLQDRLDGDRCTIGGIVTGVRRTATRKGEPMAFLQVEDLTGQTEVVVFPKLYAEADKALMAADALVLVRGRVSWRGDRRPRPEDSEGPGEGTEGEGGEVSVVAEELESFLDGPSAHATAALRAEGLLPAETPAAPAPAESPELPGADATGGARRGGGAGDGASTPPRGEPPTRAASPQREPDDGGAGAANPAPQGPVRVTVPTVLDDLGLQLLEAVLRAHPGRTPVEIHFQHEGLALRCGREFWVEEGEGLREDLAAVPFAPAPPPGAPEGGL
jgi:DNA polymerase-3 subunit alpha